MTLLLGVVGVKLEFELLDRITGLGARLELLAQATRPKLISNTLIIIKNRFINERGTRFPAKNLNDTTNNSLF